MYTCHSHAIPCLPVATPDQLPSSKFCMPGFANVFRLGTREGTYGRIVGEYQFTYCEGGKSWVRTFDDEASLAEFLRSDVAVPVDIADQALDDLRREGQATLADVDIRESEAPSIGLEQLPSES